MDLRREREPTPMKNRTTVERKSERELVVTRTINGPARIVFEAFTKPELLKRWWVPKSTGPRHVRRSEVGRVRRLVRVWRDGRRFSRGRPRERASGACGACPPVSVMPIAQSAPVERTDRAKGLAGIVAGARQQSQSAWAPPRQPLPPRRPGSRGCGIGPVAHRANLAGPVGHRARSRGARPPEQ
jgi:hypothetical protein